MNRRDMMALTFQAGVLLAGAAPALADSGHDDGPMPGDVLVRADNPGQGKIITPGDLKAGMPPIAAWPTNPAAGSVKNLSRSALVLVLKLAGPIAAEDASQGIRAFSALCTHAGCVVTGWKPEAGHLLCPCHGSEFDPARHGEAVFGPAPAPLPELKVESDRGLLTVKASFGARVGGVASRSD